MHFIFSFAHGRPQDGQGRCTHPLKRNMGGGGAFSPCVFFSLCGKYFRLVPTYKHSGGTHAFAARVGLVPNNNVALVEFERNCET